MSKRRVRLYTGPDNESTMIGFSASASDAPDKPNFKRFMESRSYITAEVPRNQVPEGSVSLRHIEVRPPLRDEDIKDFGALCVGGVVDGEWRQGIVDPYHDGTIVLDNRKMLPTAPLGGGIVISQA